MASSSSSLRQNAESGPSTEFERLRPPASNKIYDAFINHRGPDVKQTVGKELYHHLKEKRCQAFLDDLEIELGDQIIPKIRNAISSSLVQIAIFSPQYAQSSWCLDELVLMLKTKARFIPVFCDVDPSDLRRPDAGVYKDAFAKQKGRFSEETLREWKEALSYSSLFSGHRFRTSDGDVKMLCTELALAVQKEVESTKYLAVAKHPVGLDELVNDFDELVKDFERQIGHKENVVGIFAMGGAGKTTLAKALFNCERSKYDRSSFLPNVRSVKLPSLQRRLLKDLFGEDTEFLSADEGTPILRNRMERAEGRFLIVLDDVDHRDQLDALLFRKNGSLVIVTTRDENVLRNAEITIRYRLKEIEAAHGKELFCLNAFGQRNPREGYEELVDSFVELCRGLPLSIVVSAGNLVGADKKIWKLELEKFRSTLHEDIKKRLKLSFDRLDSQEQKIFMDIACFFIGELKSICKRIWKASGWTDAELSIRRLTDKCLIEMELGNSWDVRRFEDPLVFKMHDHLRDLGREMADQQSSPLRLWRPQDVENLEDKGLENLLAETKNKKIRCFSSLDYEFPYFLGNSDDRGETSTDLLWIKLHRLKEEGIPSWIPLQRLVRLEISRSRVGRLWQEDGQVPSQLKQLLIHYTPFSRFTNQIGMLNNLKDLAIEGGTDISGCKAQSVDGTSLFELLGKLSNLRRLSLRNLRVVGKLTLSMPKVRTANIRDVEFSGSKLMIIGKYCPSLEKLVLDSMQDLTEVHLGLVKSMKSLKLRKSRSLRSVSGNLDGAELKELIILDCPKLLELHTLLSSSGYIQVKDSPTLPLNGNEDLEEIEYLHLSNGQYSRIQYVSNHGLKILCRKMSNGGIRNLIQRLKILPWKATTLIGRAVDGAESILNKGLFSGIITSVGAVNDFPGKKNDDSELPVEMPHPLSAIIICMLIQTLSEENVVTIRFGPSNMIHYFPENISSTLDKGEWIVTIVLTGRENLYYVRDHIALPFMLVNGCRKNKVCTVKVKTGEEGSALSVVKKIVDELYKESASGA